MEQEPEKQPQENKEPQPKKKVIKKKRPIPLRILQFILFFVTLLVLLVVAVIIFIQTDTFNRMALDFTLEKLNESWESRESTVSADSIEGNIFTGIKLKNGAIKVKLDTMVQFNYLQVEYDIWGLLQQDINIKKLLLNEPIINMAKVRGKNDSLVWNALYLFSSDEVDVDTVETPFEWDINVKNLEIHNGTVRFYEREDPSIPLSEIKFEPMKQFGLENLELTNFNMVMDGKYLLNEKILHVKEISYNSNSDVYVKKLSFDINIDEKEKITKVTNLVMHSTRSNIWINELFMQPFDPFGTINYGEFKDKDVRIDIKADKFDFDDLKYFLPSLEFLDSAVYLELIADGKYGSLNVNKLILQTPLSYYNLSGRIDSLHNPEYLYYDVKGENLVINGNDTRILLPGLSIPNYSHLGEVSIPSLTFKGEATRFNTTFDVRSNAGTIEGNAFIDANNPYLVYKGEVDVRGLNVGRILQDQSLASNLNGYINIDGRGTDIGTSDIKVNFDISGSRFYEQNISKASGYVNLNRNSAQLDVFYLSNMLNTKVAGRVNNFLTPSRMSYALKGYTKGLNIAAFTKDQSQRSNLNLVFDVRGTGLSPENISGKFDVNVSRSQFAGFIIPDAKLRANLSAGNGQSSIDLRSAIADFTASGRFSVPALQKIITDNINEIKTELTKYVSREDTLSRDTTEIVSAGIHKGKYNLQIPAAPDVNLTYTLNIKDLDALQYSLDSSLYLKANIRGTLSNQNDVFTFSAISDSLDLKYGDTTFFTRDGYFNFALQNNPVDPGLDGFSSKLQFYSDSVMLANQSLDSLGILFSFRDYSNNYQINAVKDTAFIVTADGMLDFFNNKIRTNIDELKFKYGTYNLENNGILQASYLMGEGNSGIDFENFNLRSGSQRMEITGIYSFDSTSNVHISADNISVAEIQKFTSPGIDEDELIAGNLRRVEIDFKGTQEDPNLYAEINTDPFSVEEMQLGRLDAILEYKDDVLTPDISFFNMNNEGNLKIYGEIPFKNPLMPGDSAEFTSLADQQVDLKVDANNFQFALLSQFVPSISDLEGNLNGNLKITGIASRPFLTGALNIRNTFFTFDMTNMYYGFEADLSTQQQKLIVTGSKLYDPDEDDRFITTTGYIDFTDLKLNDINLSMEGDVKVFDRGSQPSKLGISGDLIAGSGTPKLSLTGNGDQLELTGNLILKSGNITLNPLGGTTYDVFKDDFKYNMTIDTASISDSLFQIINNEIKRLKQLDYTTLNPFEKMLVPEIADTTAAPEPSLFIYDVHVTSERDIYLRFIVNERTKQEFFGEVNADLYIDNRANDTTMNAFGTVELGDDAYYRFYKRFNAGGTIEFSGEVANPKLNVNAEYISRSIAGNDYSNSADEYKVILKVTGRAQKPDIAFSVQKNGVPIGGSDPTSEAMSLVLFGRPLSSGVQSNIVTSIGANVGSIFVSDYLSNIVQTALPFVVNTDLNYVDSRDGSIAQNTELTLTAEFGYAIVKVGGQIFQDVDNANIIIQYPLNRLLKIESLGNNLVLQLERVVDPFSSSTIDSDNRDTRTGGLVYYRIKF